MHLKRILFCAGLAALAGAVACGSGSHSISGSVQDVAGGAAGVTVSLAGPKSATTTTDASGRYAFTGLPDGTYTVTPSKASYRCSPAAIRITLEGADAAEQDFSTFESYAITGNVAGASNVTVSLSGSASASVTTDAAGNYAFPDLADGSYTVTPSASGYAFTPFNAAVTVSGASVGGQDFAATYAPNVHAITGTVTGVSGVTVTLSGANTGTVPVNEAGAYGFDGLPNGQYTVRPSKPGYAFTPPSFTVTLNGAAAQASFTAVTHSISGTVAGAAGVRVNLSGAGTATTVTDASGNYRFTGLGNLDYTVSAAQPGQLFAPTSLPVRVQGADVAGQNFTAGSRYWYPETQFRQAWNAVWGSGPNDVWAATTGDLGSILHWDGASWVVVGNGIGGVAMWGSAANDVWVAGGVGAATAHWDGTQWSKIGFPSSAPGGSVRALTGTGPNDAWAVGHSGLILHWSGASWEDRSWNGTVQVTTAALKAALSLGPNEVWAAGDSGTILRWNGTAWEDKGLNADSTRVTTRTINGLWGTGANDIWAVGGGGGSVILHWDGTAWTRIAHPGTSSLYAVWGTSARDVWAIGSTILHWDGVRWEDKRLRGDGTVVNSAQLNAIWGSSASSVWMVGEAGTALLHDGRDWSPSLRKVGNDINSLWGSSLDDIWGVGYAGTIVHSDGTGWQDRSLKADGTPVTTQSLLATWGSARDDVWAVGYSGAVLHFDGTGWSAVASGTTSGLRGLWGSAANDVWVVGEGGTILRWNGSTWEDKGFRSDGTTRITTQRLVSVWGTGPNDIWILGDSVLLHWTGGPDWVADPRPFTAAPQLWGNSVAICGTSPSDVWIAGFSVLIHYNGTSWTQQALNMDGFGAAVTSVWASSPNDVWASWYWGFWHWDGSTWSKAPVPTNISAIWGVGSTAVAAGNGIYRLP